MYIDIKWYILLFNIIYFRNIGYIWYVWTFPSRSTVLIQHFSLPQVRWKDYTHWCYNLNKKSIEKVHEEKSPAWLGELKSVYYNATLFVVEIYTESIRHSCFIVVWPERILVALAVDKLNLLLNWVALVKVVISN